MLACYGCAYPILSFSHTHNGGALLRLKSVGISWNQHLIAFKCSVVVFPLASLCQLIITWSSIYCTYYIPSKYCMCFANSSWNSANSSWKSANSFWVQKPENRKAQIKRPTPIVRYIYICIIYTVYINSKHLRHDIIDNHETCSTLKTWGRNNIRGQWKTSQSRSALKCDLSSHLATEFHKSLSLSVVFLLQDHITPGHG